VFGKKIIIEQFSVIKTYPSSSKNGVMQNVITILEENWIIKLLRY